MVAPWGDRRAVSGLSGPEAAVAGLRPEAARGGYLRKWEHGMLIVLFPQVQVVISPLALCSQAAAPCYPRNRGSAYVPSRISDGRGICLRHLSNCEPGIARAGPSAGQYYLSHDIVQLWLIAGGGRSWPRARIRN